VYVPYYSEYSAKLTTGKIKIKNDTRILDSIYVSGIGKGYVIRIYNSRGYLLKAQTSKSSSMTLFVNQLGAFSGKISLTSTRPYRRTSAKTYVAYAAEQTPSLFANQISVTNNRGMSDVISIKGLKKEDVIRIYQSNGKQIVSKISEGYSTKLSVNQLGTFSGKIYVTVTRPKLLQSSKTTAAYKSEPIVKQSLSTVYPYTMNDAVTKQIAARSQTDKNYNKFIIEDALQVSNDTGVIKATPDPKDKDKWNVRGGPSTENWVITQIAKGNKVYSVRRVQNTSWFQIDFKTGWVNASPSDIRYYLNPFNAKSGTTSYYQFLKLSSSTSVNIDEVNSKILAGRGILTGKGAVFIKAANQQHINEIYLIAHALLETGNGSFQLAKGIRVTKVNGKSVTPKLVYNMFGIGAVDSDPVKEGSEYAYTQGWFTPETAIMGGAKFIGDKYINNSTYHQDTLYKMRWNPANPAIHQYASDIGWAVKQTSFIKSLYDRLSSYSIKFDIPKYKD
jgi:beta-N-acetylglucosaminidase